MSDSVTYEYDLNGRLKLVTFENDDTVEVTFDDMGNRESVETTIASPLRLTSSGDSVANGGSKTPQA